MNGFVLYKDKAAMIKKMDDELAGRILKAMIDYNEHGVTPKGEKTLEIIFEAFRADIDKAKERHEQVTRQRSEAGKRGAMAKHGKAKQNLAKPGNVKQIKQNGTEWNGKEWKKKGPDL